jgi:hypothetical protein
MICRDRSTGDPPHRSAQQEVLSRKALLTQIAAACGPQQHLFLAATSRRWRSLYCAYSAAQETSYQSCLATPQLMKYTLQAGLADIHRHSGNRAKIVQPPVWLFRQTAQCAVTETDLDDPDSCLLDAFSACSEQQCRHRLAATDLLRLVVLFGSLETLQWCTASMLKQAGALPSLVNRQALSFCAARRGDGHILAWLQHAHLLEFEWQNAHGARWALTDTAAEQGHVQTVQLLHGQGCPLGVYVCEAAARHGELAFLQWSHKCGADFGGTELAQAAGEAGSNQLDMLIYLQSIIRPELWSGAAEDALAVAGQQGHLQSVIWLRKHAGAAWPASLWGYSYWSDPACLQWAVQHGASWGSESGQAPAAHCATS